MSETTAATISTAEARAHYERMLARALDRADPASPGYRAELAASAQAEARILTRALQQMDDARLAQAVAPVPVPPAVPPAVQPAAETHPRDAGRFMHGNPGGPGRPRKIQCVEHDCVSVVVNSISAQDLHDITRVAVAQAKQGDGAARRWIYQMAFRHSRTSINEVAALQETGITASEHRMLLAQKHFGRDMEDIELYRQEVAAETAAAEPPALERPAVSDPPAARPAVVAAEPTVAEPTSAAASAHRATPNAGVVEVRLGPCDPPARNAQKRSITVENGADGPGRARSNGRAEPQVA